MEEVVNYLEDTIKQLMSEINILTKKVDELNIQLTALKNENMSLKETLETYKDWDHVN